jgi:hypothetical protein
MAKKLSDLYQDLKSSIVGTKTAKIDAALDKAVKDIVSYKSHSGRNGYIDLVRTVIAKSSSGMGFGNNGLYSHGQTGPAAFGQGTRLMRYKTYDAIVSYINYAYRALTVLVDNILSPDDITKVSLDVKPKKYLEDETHTNSKVKRVKDVIKTIELESKLSLIVRSTLQYGDFFCEIAPPKTALTSRSIISESQNYINYRNKQIEDGIKDVWTEDISTSSRKENILRVSIDYSSFMEQNTNDKSVKKAKEEQKILANLSLVFHKPNLVIKLQSGLFPVCFGYLVFPDVKGMTSMGGASLEDDAVNNICISILRNLEKKIPQMTEYKDNKELKDIIKYMISKSDPNQALEIRYVPPDKMTHFKVPSAKYHPYGESIYDPTQYIAKVLISLETALAVQRLSRSTEKRKIAVEVGLPRDARKAIELMKEEFRKRKVSLDSFGTVDTIPSMITTFEDVYIPQKDGKPFVDVSTFNEGNVDIRSKVDELKFLRDQLTATWGVPPSFLGIEENLSNKAALSEENILFARTVISHQKYLSEQITKLLEKVFEIVDPDESLTIFESVDVHLPTPKSLQYEREARYMNELVGLIESLERVGIPKEYSKKKYLSNFDWEEIKKYDIDEKVEQTLDPTKKEDDGMGGMGGAGGFGGGAF